MTPEMRIARGLDDRLTYNGISGGDGGHHRQTSRMRVGRAFLAGDAAHIHSPFGAQGMNAAQAIRNRAIPKRMLDTFSIRPFVDLCPSAG